MYTRSILIPITFLLLTACGSKPNSDAASGDALSGNINIDGSSTVYPITEAVAEEFQKVQPGVKVSVALSGTGGGFKKLKRTSMILHVRSNQPKTASLNPIM